jgi:branched-chain amino acid transport system permease protein
MKEKNALIASAVVVVLLAVVPFIVDVDKSYFVFFLFLTFVHIIIAQGWNIVGGYTGQVSLGQHAFFGLGAYTMGMNWVHNITHTGYFFDPVTMILSGLVPVALAIIIGIPLLSRLRGDYFALGTLGVGEIIKVVFVKGGDITGASDGLHLPSTQFTTMEPYYWVGLLLAIAATAAVYWLIRSRIGLALKAIREDEDAAASHGIYVLKYKILAFSIGAFMAGVCGCLYGYYLFHINPDAVLKLNWTLYPILMCVIGGAGTVLGPVIGAFFMTAVFTLADIYFVQINPVIAGLLIIFVMKFMPAGLIGLGARFTSGRSRSNKV